MLPFDKATGAIPERLEESQELHEIQYWVKSDV